MSNTTYIAILTLIVICFAKAFLMTGVFFGMYCSAVAASEGRLDELLEDGIGTEDWGPYRRELFRRLYKIENCNDGNIFKLKKKAQWGFFSLTIFALLFIGILLFSEISPF